MGWSLSPARFPTGPLVSGEDVALSCVPGFSYGGSTSLRAFAQKSINFEDYAVWSIGHGSRREGSA
jgi:hypothetical protein